MTEDLMLQNELSGYADYAAKVRYRLPAAAVCISPMTDLAGTGESFRIKHDPTLAVKFALIMARHYAGNQDLRLPLLSPHYGDLRGLPPLLIHGRQHDTLVSVGA